MAKLLLTPTEAAEALGTTVDHVRRLLRSGDLPGVRLGRYCRIPSEGLARWCETQTTGRRAESDSSTR